MPHRPLLLPTLAFAALSLSAQALRAQQSGGSYGDQITTTYALYAAPYERTASCTRLYEVPEALRPLGLAYVYHISEPFTRRAANVGTDSLGRALYLYLHLIPPRTPGTPGRGVNAEVATLQWARDGSLVAARHAVFANLDTLGNQGQTLFTVTPQEARAAMAFASESLALCAYRDQVPGRPGRRPH